MALTQIDIDEDALAEAMRLSGAKTKKETVNVALREFAARHRRIAALEHYATLAAGWDFEGGGSTAGAAEKDPGDVIRYLLDSSALWRIRRDPALRAAWAEVVSAGAIGSCHPQRRRVPPLRPHHRRVRADVGNVRGVVPGCGDPQGSVAVDRVHNNTACYGRERTGHCRLWT